MTKIVSQLDAEGYFVGPAEADESPLEPGVYHLPAGCVDAAPITVPEGKRAKWGGSSFELEDIPLPEPEPEPEPPTPEQIIRAFTTAIQKRLDDFARTRNYDGILSACTYATSTVPKFQTEGQYCVQARDATWSAAYNILAQVELGQRPVPASIADIENELPVLAWPN